MKKKVIVVMEEFVGSSNLPSMSYCTSGTTTFQQNHPGILSDSQLPTQSLLQAQGLLSNLFLVPEKKKEEKETKIMARLIRFTVVDPDSVLADKNPERSIIMSGSRMLNGTNDQGFLMDIAGALSKELEKHNEFRATIAYEDKEGKSRTLKPIKLSNLDVVLEVLKQY